MQAKSTFLAVTVVLITLLSGCASAPPPRPTVTAPPGTQLPIPAKVLFEIAPSQRNFSVSTYRYSWQYCEASVMTAPALQMLRGMFSEVVSSEGPIAGGPVFQISGYTSINPGLRTYYATALADVFVRTDSGERQIGRYRGTGQAVGMIYSYYPLQLAYAAAFSDLSKKILADPALMQQLPASARR